MKIELSARKIKVVTLFLLMFAFQNNLSSQCKPMIKIDGKATVVDFTDGFGLALPFWLTENQTLAIGSSVNSISVIEFKVNGTTLEFSRVINVTSTAGETVPQSYVWKIESVAKQNNSSTYNKATFSKSGSYSWIVPDCAEEICIDLWGAGGSLITGTSVQVAGSYGVTGGSGGAAGGSPTSMGGHGGSLGSKSVSIVEAAIPGGGGGGMYYSSGVYNGGAAAPGRVIVTW